MKNGPDQMRLARLEIDRLRSKLSTTEHDRDQALADKDQALASCGVLDRALKATEKKLGIAESRLAFALDALEGDVVAEVVAFLAHPSQGGE